jgi:histidinol phosphatase-like PHP family hydrolase
MRYGIRVARRAWLEKKDVLNTFGLRELRAALEK